MSWRMLIPTLTLTAVLAAPAAGVAETARPRGDEPRGFVIAALFGVREWITDLWPALAGEPESPAGGSEESGGGSGGEGQGNADPSGAGNPTPGGEASRVPAP